MAISKRNLSRRRGTKRKRAFKRRASFMKKSRGRKMKGGCVGPFEKVTISELVVGTNYWTPLGDRYRGLGPYVGPTSEGFLFGYNEVLKVYDKNLGNLVYRCAGPPMQKPPQPTPRAPEHHDSIPMAIPPEADFSNIDNSSLYDAYGSNDTVFESPYHY